MSSKNVDNQRGGAGRGLLKRVAGQEEAIYVGKNLHSHGKQEKDKKEVKVPTAMLY